MNWKQIFILRHVIFHFRLQIDKKNPCKTMHIKIVVTCNAKFCLFRINAISIVQNVRKIERTFANWNTLGPFIQSLTMSNLFSVRTNVYGPIVIWKKLLAIFMCAFVREIWVLIKLMPPGVHMSLNTFKLSYFNSYGA